MKHASGHMVGERIEEYVGMNDSASPPGSTGRAPGRTVGKELREAAAA
jgi:hypothetical protein